MNISRNFLVIGSLYLLVGVTLGTVMGATGDHSLMGVHAHINLVGFALMSIFGLIYRAFPAMAENMLGTIHFWGHQLSAVVFLIALYFLLSESASEAAVGPIIGISTVVLCLATAVFVWNLIKNGN